MTRRPYTYRSPAVEAERAALPPVGTPGFLAAGLAAVHPETAATAIRRALAAGRLADARQVGDHLAGLVAARIRAIAWSHFPRDPVGREELAGACALSLWQVVSDLRPSQDFVQYNLPCVLNREAHSLAARLRRQAPPTLPLYEYEGATEAALDDGLLAGDLLACLPPRERITAVLLARGLSTTEIARVLGVTDRAVRYYRARAARRITAAETSSAAAPTPARVLPFAPQRNEVAA